MQVDEPSVEDSIAILRGLKERYELHHAVDISDPALVAAANLSHRYITDRRLPDKAIDLIDEAASRIRMEIDSKPEEMDRLERRLIQLKIEVEALKKENDDASIARLAQARELVAELEGQFAQLDDVWRAEKASLQGAQSIKEQLDDARVDYETARRGGDLARMSELQYGLIPELEKSIREQFVQPPEIQGKFWKEFKEEDFDRNQENLKLRLSQIPIELEKEKERITRHYSEPTPRLFPVAVMLLVPK